MDWAQFARQMAGMARDLLAQDSLTKLPQEQTADISRSRPGLIVLKDRTITSPALASQHLSIRRLEPADQHASPSGVDAGGHQAHP
ncbi:hypothetical protein ACIPSE_44795 [Streptomyces sp. NPDC090106]|uniref:hypothetical protein n=1 Tax=Streptomyces sp. NPDC090106 TaxID=3365946 RepID=UPI00382A8757